MPLDNKTNSGIYLLQLVLNYRQIYIEFSRVKM